MGKLAALLLAMAVGSCATAKQDVALSDPVAFALSVREGRTDAASYDFAAHGLWAMNPADRAAWRVAEEAALLPPGAREASCAAEDLRGLEGDIWIFMALSSQSDAQWRSDWTVLESYRERARAQLAMQLSGGADPQSPIAKYAAARQGANDPRVRELFARAIADQSALLANVDVEGEGASAKWAALRAGLAAPRIARTACSNSEWLASQIQEHGWFDAPTYGASADDAAWLIVQHGERDLAFQRHVLGVLESLPAGATNARNLAYLSDRIAVAEHRPQRYGTQLQCDNHRQAPRGGLEDGDNLDARRASAGLAPMAQYLAEMNRNNRCR